MYKTTNTEGEHPMSECIGEGVDGCMSELTYEEKLIELTTKWLNQSSSRFLRGNR